ncbi:methionyl-tRNA formyltransferase [Chloroflexota bacterium]
MNAVIVTQEEPFYIPVFLSKVLADYNKVIAVIILKGTPKGFTALSYIKRLYEVFGLRDFIAYGVLFMRYKLLNRLTMWRQFGRFYSVKSAARRNSIPVYKVKDINGQKSLRLLKTLRPDVIVSVAAPQIFKKRVINSAKYIINIHAALLPKYRGMMPSFWVLAKGEEKTGLTVHHMNEHVDTGDAILQETIDISPQDTLHSLQIKVANVGSAVLLEALKKIKDGNGSGFTLEGEGSYYSFPTNEAAKELKARGRRFI